MSIDPITLEILWRRLISIVDEADSTVSRTAFSSLLRDAHDYTCMFTDRRGREYFQVTFPHKDIDEIVIGVAAVSGAGRPSLISGY